jgi:hypothetical protein
MSFFSYITSFFKHSPSKTRETLKFAIRPLSVSEIFELFDKNWLGRKVAPPSGNNAINRKADFDFLSEVCSHFLSISHHFQIIGSKKEK